MKSLKTILSIILAGVLAFQSWGSNPNWKMHTTFDSTVANVTETPEYVYFTSKALPDYNSQVRLSLFRYDKKGEELQALSTDNVLTSTTISAMQYCPQKGYVVAVGSNYDIIFLYDDGKVSVVTDYRLASMTQPKDVNSITIDPWHDRVYLATGFGYVAVNDEKKEIAESRIYNSDIASMARIGDRILLLSGDKVLEAEASASRLTLADYKEAAGFEGAWTLMPFDEDNFLIITKVGNTYRAKASSFGDDGKLSAREVLAARFYNIVNNKEGIFVTRQSDGVQIYPDGKLNVIARPEEDKGMAVASYDLTEFWTGADRKGLKSGEPGVSAGEWTVTRDFIVPEAPAPFISTDIQMHPTEGLMFCNYGYDPIFNKYPQPSQFLLTGYKNGWWENYSPAYTNPVQANVLQGVNGFAVDPDDPRYIYLTSAYKGIARINIEDPEDIIHLSKPTDNTSNLPGFVKFVDEHENKDAKWACRFSAPRFDAAGNLWMVYTLYDDQQKPYLALYCWTADDRRATTGADNVILPKMLKVDGIKSTFTDLLVPLKHASNKNCLLYATTTYYEMIKIIDTKGTPLDSADDVVVDIKNFVDQDGNSVTVRYIYDMWEDPLTGKVWVCHWEGVFTFNPADFLSGSGRISRIKVARNDGTNLADYLLDAVRVNRMTTDGSGRKWFATTGGGAVCTSSDGRTIEAEITTQNSDLPSDNVYGICYNPDNRSMIFSTAEGISEYFMGGSSQSAADDGVKIYPNPVRPEYLGYVNIEGLPDKALVKITDASGNIVKELGLVSRTAQWDVTNHQFKRVSSGVYYVLVSAGENESAVANVGKILVIN